MNDLDLSSYAIRNNNARQEINDLRLFADVGDISKTINTKLGSQDEVLMKSEGVSKTQRSFMS